MTAAPLLLDTCALIWTFSGVELDADVQAAIAESAESGTLHLSPISAWEIGMLVAKERLALSIPVQDWIDRAFSNPGVRTAPTSPAVFAAASFLPGSLHGDPADRILIATARANGLTLVTRDGRILSYAQKGHLAALPC